MNKSTIEQLIKLGVSSDISYKDQIFENCPECYDPFQKNNVPTLLKCGHFLCGDCLVVSKFKDCVVCKKLKVVNIADFKLGLNFKLPHLEEQVEEQAREQVERQVQEVVVPTVKKYKFVLMLDRLSDRNLMIEGTSEDTLEQLLIKSERFKPHVERLNLTYESLQIIIKSKALKYTESKNKKISELNLELYEEHQKYYNVITLVGRAQGGIEK